MRVKIGNPRTMSRLKEVKKEENKGLGISGSSATSAVSIHLGDHSLLLALPPRSSPQQCVYDFSLVFLSKGSVVWQLLPAPRMYFSRSLQKCRVSPPPRPFSQLLTAHFMFLNKSSPRRPPPSFASSLDLSSLSSGILGGGGPPLGLFSVSGRTGAGSGVDSEVRGAIILARLFLVVELLSPPPKSLPNHPLTRFDFLTSKLLLLLGGRLLDGGR